ncbi:flagellar basal body P-ring formation chaperone FlgA [Paracoccus sulfuroxidans]|uniref:Flagella basal body P-ring formation protein FlgA n=1 Tax=Paracoccus sulfuroxidans TaxID=384678 RepID=A0A562NU56_9RHOB|nr:flagellar basal body P-ring formation chaperone FlgA [Paracoccus sulfuroxidans]TWI35744.1 flagella basal body P-ring formation protein FlgA [Paracoccus sulfuroxidans]
MRYLLPILAALCPAVASAEAVTAARTLPAGTVIAASDVIAANTNEVDPILGRQTRVTIYEGRQINPATLTTPTLIDRNQIVTISYVNASLRIDAEGRALSAGSAGETIRVMNNASRITVSGRVAADGTVVVRQY